MADEHAIEEHESAKKHGDPLDSMVPGAGQEDSARDGKDDERKPAPSPIK